MLYLLGVMATMLRRRRNA